MNTHLALTISPPNRMKGTKLRNYNRFLFEEDILHIRAVFKYNKIRNFIIFPELDDRGRLHYHGIVSLNPSQYVRYRKHAEFKLRLLGFVDAKPLKGFLDHLRWLFYCRKQFHIIQEILEITEPVMSLPTKRIKNMKHNLDTDELEVNIKLPLHTIKDFYRTCERNICMDCREHPQYSSERLE